MALEFELGNDVEVVPISRFRPFPSNGDSQVSLDSRLSAKDFGNRQPLAMEFSSRFCRARSCEFGQINIGLLVTL
jgi:hypothetical protein